MSPRFDEVRPPVKTPWMRLDQASEYAQLSKATLLRACRAHVLQHVRVGGRGMVVTRAEWVDAYLNKLVVPVEAER